MLYITSGISWLMPYDVLYEDELILCLKELPIVHKRNAPDLMRHPHKFVDIPLKRDTITIDGTIKLLEITK